MKTINISKQPPEPNSRIEDRLDVPRPVVVLALDYPSGYYIEPHRHSRAQLVYAATGAMTVTTTQGAWVAPPQRGVWVPALREHSVRASGRLAMRSVYVEPEAARVMPGECCAVAVPPLLRELILHAADLDKIYPLGGPEERLMTVILDRIRALETAPLHLPAPTDARLAAIAHGLETDPGDNRTLAGWGREVGAGSRTLARLFKAETGLTFGQWRQQFRLLEALRRLARGGAVTTVALDLGYDSPSAFIAMFRKALGSTPGRYFRDLGQSRQSDFCL